MRYFWGAIVEVRGFIKGTIIGRGHYNVVVDGG